ncbi:12010_t:CDS:2 [Cetraspora pellucida]|uniref:12010_t:CDS:1 n=1 Tax=Cetraspora pellucida TaxID=1433469 RepID=A0ACA9KYY9_9GLOM|nr:12010_t:CDS:2 [Cetraspora pellucida]
MGWEDQKADFGQQIWQLLQVVAGILPQALQNNQVRELNVVNVPIFSGGNQDPVEWLKAGGHAFEVNNIQEPRRIAVIRAYLTRMAAMCFVHQFCQNFCTQMLMSQWSTEQVTVRGNEYSEVIKTQIFVQELQPNLALAVGLFMLGTLQAAIERVKVSELSFSRSMTIPNTMLFVNPTVTYLQQPIVEAKKSSTPDQVEDSVKKLTTLIEELVVSLKNNDNIESLFEVYAAKKRKRNDDKAVVIGTYNDDKEEADDHMNKTRKASKKRKTKLIEPLITSNIQYYLIMTNLQNKKADITYAQLFQVTLNIRKEILKITRTSHITTTKIAEFCSEQDVDVKTTSMYCEAQVKEYPILLILDSVIMIKVHGEQKCPLGKIDKFSITVKGKTITFQVVVSEARNYAVIVRNDLMKKAKARLDWEECKLMIRDGKKKIRVPTEYCKSTSIREQILKKEKFNNEKSEEENTTDEEMKSESNKNKDEYEEENLMSRAYLYWEFLETGSEFETCKICLKKRHISKECVFKKKCKIIDEETGQLRRTSVMSHEIFTEEGPPIKQKFYPISRPEHEFIGSEIRRMKEARIICLKGGKLEVQWLEPYWIHEVFGNGVYKLRTLEGKVLVQSVHAAALEISKEIILNCDHVTLKIADQEISEYISVSEKKTQAEKIRENLYIYLLDLNCRNTLNPIMPLETPKEKWDEKLANGWNEAAKRELHSYFKAVRSHTVLKIIKKTYQLFFTCGEWYILIMEHINISTLEKMYDEDFTDCLLVEA